MARMRHILSALVFVALASLPRAAAAQTPDTGQLDVVAELRRLRTELNEARAELRQLQSDLDQLKTPAATPEGPALSAQVEMLQTQVAEHAQTKVESVSRLPVKIFGTIHSSFAANSGEANWLENPEHRGATPDPEWVVELDAAADAVGHSCRRTRAWIVAGQRLSCL